MRRSLLPSVVVSRPLAKPAVELVLHVVKDGAGITPRVVGIPSGQDPVELGVLAGVLFPVLLLKEIVPG